MGFNPYGLRTAKALWHDVGLDAAEDSGEYEFADHAELPRAGDADRRHIIHKADLAEYQKNPEVVARRRGGSAARADACTRSGSTKATRGAWRSI